MRKKNVFLVLLLLISFSTLPSQVYPYSKETHPIITRHALGYTEEYGEPWYEFPEYMEYTLGEDGINVEQYLSREEVAERIGKGGLG